MESISRIEAFVNVLDAFLSILWMGSLAACFRLRPKPSSKRRFSVRCGINAEKPRLFQDDLTRQDREDEQQTERKREEDSERGGIRESKRERKGSQALRYNLRFWMRTPIRIRFPVSRVHARKSAFACYVALG